VIEREFIPQDLDGAWFVTAAATPDVNRAVRDAAERRGVFVNAVDDPSNASAYLGGTIVRGGVTVAFSTAGKAPALAGLLREGFEALLPDDLERWAEQAHELSLRQRRERVPMPSRRPQLLDTLNELYERRAASPALREAGRA
jgi:uroporphyrin-III C-methyltransferase/precorrin-2 dehydrogenase/sirohydrochlorin ferrochelatase